MGGKAPTRLAEVLAQGRLGRLISEAGHRRSMTEQIRARLPADEAEHLVSATLNAEGDLVLAMDSGLWAARVRYRAAELAEVSVARIRVRVVPSGR